MISFPLGARTLFGLYLTAPVPWQEDELESGVATVFELGESETQREFFFPATGNSILLVYASGAVDLTLHAEDADGNSLGEAKGTATSSALLRLVVGAGEEDEQEVWVRVESDDDRQSAEVTLKLTAFAPLSPADRAALTEIGRLIVRAQAQLRAVGRVNGREPAEQAREKWKTFPDPDHPEVQGTRGNLAITMGMLGNLRASRLLFEQMLEVFTRTLPPDHSDLHRGRANLANTIASLGDLQGARALEEEVLEVFSRTLPDAHSDLQDARGNLASTLRALGDLQGARALQQKVVEVFSRTLAPDHPELQLARLRLGVTLNLLGDLEGARALHEEVLEVRSRTLPADHIDLQRAKAKLAETMQLLGDLQGALELQEEVLVVFSRTLSPDDPFLQEARSDLATTKQWLGDFQGARALQEEVLEVFSRTLPADHPHVQIVRSNLANTMAALGNLQGARELLKDVLEINARTLPADHPRLHSDRVNLANTLRALGDLQGARTLLEEALEIGSRTLPADHPYLQGARSTLTWTCARLGAWHEAGELALELARSTTSVVESLGGPLSPRELEALTTWSQRELYRCLSLARYPEVDVPALEAETFRAVETARASAVTRQRTLRSVAAEGLEVDALRSEIQAATAAAARQARMERTEAGSAEPEVNGQSLFDVLRRKESAERKLHRRLADLAREQGVLAQCGAEDIAHRLGADEAAVGYWRYNFRRIDRQSGEELPSESSYLAYILRRDQPLVRVELGAAQAIHAAVKTWRRSIRSPVRGIEGLDPPSGPDPTFTAGEAVRRLVFDPLREALGDARRVVVAADDALHLVPLSVLPDGEGVLGDSWEMVYRPTLKELSISDRGTLHPPSLLAFGDVAYQKPPQEVSGNPITQSNSSQDMFAGAPADVLSSAAWRSFSTLPWTGAEAEAVGDYMRQTYESEELNVTVLKGQAASRQAFERLAGSVRYLHLATHGYFTDESVPSMRDERVVDEELGLRTTLSMREQVRGLSPMVLCGLAFAGANLDPNDYGYVEGVMTAEEIAQMDLTGCELCVLSACDTNVGVRRAGKGMASLQQALFAAGVRASITSLWRVPDAATSELMAEFYRRWWVLGESKHDALWNAQQKLRRAEDEFGDAKYLMSDWAAWVLTGDPD